MAADRIVPTGLAMPRPAMSGAEPWMGSYRPLHLLLPSGRPESEAEGSRPSAPGMTDDSSDKMSPNMFFGEHDAVELARVRGPWTIEAEVDELVVDGDALRGKLRVYGRTLPTPHLGPPTEPSSAERDQERETVSQHRGRNEQTRGRWTLTHEGWHLRFLHASSVSSGSGLPGRVDGGATKVEGLEVDGEGVALGRDELEHARGLLDDLRADAVTGEDDDVVRLLAHVGVCDSGVRGKSALFSGWLPLRVTCRDLITAFGAVAAVGFIAAAALPRARPWPRIELRTRIPHLDLSPLPTRKSRATLTSMSSSAKKEAILRDFRQLTRATPQDAHRILKAHGYRLEAATNAFFSDEHAQLNALASSSTLDKKTEREVTQRLNTLFDRFRAAAEDDDDDDDEDAEASAAGAAEDPDVMSIGGALKMCEALEVSPEDVVFLPLSFYLRSPSIGTFTRTDYVAGWKMLDLSDTLEKQKKTIEKLRQELLENKPLRLERVAQEKADPATASSANKGLYEKVYEYTYAFARP
ncbi:hypothetical protein L1887_58443 [Cichorium endivia]|nr:hypothetical protein L1887_58443 [Cichorium endivia]